MAVTLKDIAAHCGLAVSTVSNILNNHKDSYASVRVKKMVKDTARDMGYRKDYLSVSLRTKTTRSIGLCLDFLVDETRGFFINTFIEAFNRKGYEVAINSHNAHPDAALSALSFFEQRYKDGIIFFTDFLRTIPQKERNALITRLSRSKSKILGIGSELRGHLPCIDIDRNWAFKHCFNRFDRDGHKKILLVYKSPVEFRESFSLIKERNYLCMDKVYSFADFEKKWPDMYHKNPDISACFFRTDDIAIPALRYFRTHNISVPGDLSVCSFDHFSYSQYTTPPLTTYDINFGPLGKKAYKILLSWIDGGNDFPKDFYKTIRPSYIERESHTTISHSPLKRNN